MEDFTIHIFGYGETQINSKTLSIKVKTKNLTNVQPIIEHIFSKKPTDNSTQISEYHVIHLFGYEDVRWLSKHSFMDKEDDELKPLIDSLISELQVLFDNSTSTNN